MGSGTNWNLTTERIKYVQKQLHAQSSLTLIASHLGVSLSVLSAKLVEAGIDWKQVKRDGLHDLRKRMYSLIGSQTTEKDEFDAGMKYLARYEKLESDEGTTETTSKVDVRLQILQDLDV